jgi:uncharacterized tellurite resistance protein B-like protein
MTYQIPGVASAEEASLLAALEQVRKAGGGDGDDPRLAAEAALQRLAKAGATNGKTEAQSYMDVLATPQGASLYRIAKSQGEAVIVDKAAALAAIRKIAAG